MTLCLDTSTDSDSPAQISFSTDKGQTLSLSDYGQRLPGSPVREILSVSQQPGMISFAGGLPDTRVMPELPVLTSQELAGVAQYGTSEGEVLLKQQLVSWLEGEGLTCEEDQVLITSGSQQGLDLAARLLVDPGSEVIVEDPSYLAMLQILNGLGAELLPFELSEQGVDLAVLERLLKTRQPRMLYLIPTFQNPTGYCYSEQERIAVAELVDRYGVILVEDDPYRALNYDGAFTRPICHYVKRSPWIYLGSFSKMLWPGLRTGFMVAHPELYPYLYRAKQATDLHTNRLGQLLIARFMQSGALPGHIEQLQQHYRSKRDDMQRLLSEHLPKEVSWLLPAGGMFFWLTLSIDCQRLLQQGIENGVVVLPGSSFAVAAEGNYCLRLSFSQISLPEMEEGIKRLVALLS